VSSTDFPQNYPNEDMEWDLEKFKKNFDIKISYISGDTANFDLIGIDTSIANAFRRIMIAEVPTVAIDQVFIFNNTSIIHDEVLAQRLGLVPIMMSPDWLYWVEPADPDSDEDPLKMYNHTNTVKFTLDVSCSRNPNAPRDSTDPNELYINSNVYARDLKYGPIAEQENAFDPPPTVCNPDILLAKLRPGQQIQLTAFAVLGIGADHAKFSPVSTASYRLLPTINIIGEPITGGLARKFQSCFPPGVIEINAKGEAYVADSRKDTVSREVLRHPEFNGRVKLGRRRDHFIFNVESTGALEPDEIFVKSIQQLKRKAEELLQYDLAA
jgi:DNA-directed RNA polymerase I and III subunit RPAC1